MTQILFNFSGIIVNFSPLSLSLSLSLSIYLSISICTFYLLLWAGLLNNFLGLYRADVNKFL